MRVRSSILDSESERQLFAAISGSWEPKYRLYPQVPFTNLVELDDRALSAAELSFLHKSSVDFALAQQDGTPLLGIEFDGIAHGISTRGQYRPGVPLPSDRGRAWKLGLKLKVAEAAGFPFVVMSYDEKAILEEATHLTITHGIVGSFLARVASQKRIAELVEEEADTLAHLSPDERHEHIQDMVIAAELDSDYDWNPVFRRSIELSEALREASPMATIGHSYDQDPPRPEHCDPMEDDCDVDTFERWWTSVRRHGVTCTITTPDWALSRTVWVRNFEGTGVTPFGWMDELSELVTIPEALRHLAAGTVP